MNKEHKIQPPIRVITTSYDHGWIEIPTENWPLKKRLGWIKAIATGRDVVERRNIQHLDLSEPRGEKNDN